MILTFKQEFEALDGTYWVVFGVVVLGGFELCWGVMCNVWWYLVVSNGVWWC